MEATLIARRPDRRAIPLTVGVGHTSALVSAGLAATLARMPGCQVRQWETTSGACARNCATPAHLILGDFALLKHCRENSKLSLEICSFDKAKFVWVTARDDPLADASKAAGDVAERLSVECTEEEVFAIVPRLADSARGAAWPTVSVAEHASAGMTGQRGIALWLAALNPEVLAVVRRSVLAEELGQDRMLFNLQIAVEQYAQRKPALDHGRRPDEGGGSP